MLTIGRLAGGPGAGRYYVDQVASGREDYYAGEGQAPGVWVGNGAAALGLSGEADEDGLARLLESRDPVSGEPLRRLAGSAAVAGLDPTFRAAKSVGVVFGVAHAEVAGELRAAHHEAVAEALGYLEREASWARRGAGGAVLVQCSIPFRPVPIPSSTARLNHD